MSVIQSKEAELRYVKTANLEQEARFHANCLRDLIRSYGIDCNVYKLKIPFENFKTLVDENAILRHAYGYEEQPDYTLSANMITYMEVEQDIFLLQQRGLIPDANVNFYFDAKDFAAAFACKCGHYKEYKIDETEIVCEVPECTPESASAFPYHLGLVYPERFYCSSLSGNEQALSGRFKVDIKPYELDKEYEVMCDPFEHTDLLELFPVNPYIYKSFKYKVRNDDYLNILLKMKYKVVKVQEKCILKGKLSGTILFYDMHQLGKYLDMIHPEVGDVITIGFPNNQSREQYEITESLDKNLGSDGLNPFLHKYIWKCKARRYINNANAFPEKNEANDRLNEVKDFEKQVERHIVENLEHYDDNEDAVYGGYDKITNDYDKNKPDPSKQADYDYINEGTAVEIHHFGCGSEIVTDGYELYFKSKPDIVTQKSTVTKLTKVEAVMQWRDNFVADGLEYLKATPDGLYFINFDDKVAKLAQDKLASKGELTMCLDNLFQSTLSQNDINNGGDEFYKFPNCKTVLWATETDLYCRLESNGKLYKLT